MFLVRFILCVLLTFGFQFHSRAETYVIGAQNISYFPHYEFQSNIDKGLAWAILEAYAKKSGHKFEYIALPIVRLQKELEKGNIDFAYPDNPKWHKKKLQVDKKIYSNPLVRALGGTIVVPQARGQGIDSIKRLSLPLGFSPVKWQSRIEQNLTRLVPVSDSRTALQFLTLGQADAADLEYSVAKYLSNSTHALSEVILDPSLPYDDVGFRVATLNHPKLIDELNKFLQEESELVESLKAKYQIESPRVVLSRLLASN